jgi:hypothetical protein
MKAVEFESTVSAGGQISLPPEVASEIYAGDQIRVVLMWDRDDSERSWRSMGRQRFDAVYAPEDAVYEQLLDNSAIR